MKATTSSDKIVRKRKRKGLEQEELQSEPSATTDLFVPRDVLASTTTIPTKTHDGGNKPKRAPKSNASPTLQRNDSTSSNSVTSTIPWPASTRELERTHQALNLVFTFCCTRKHFATTFDNIKSAVEAHIKRVLKIEDVAAIVALRPGGINFTYVDEAMLQVDIRGAERDDTFKSGGKNSYHPQALPPDASVGGLTGNEELGSGCGGGDAEPGKEVLFFEFIDGDLKRQVENKKSGEATKATRKLRNEDLTMPVN